MKGWIQIIVDSGGIYDESSPNTLCTTIMANIYNMKCTPAVLLNKEYNSHVIGRELKNIVNSRNRYVDHKSARTCMYKDRDRDILKLEKDWSYAKTITIRRLEPPSSSNMNKRRCTQYLC